MGTKFNVHRKKVNTIGEQHPVTGGQQRSTKCETPAQLRGVFRQRQ
jgi:hypothetical protein